MWVYFFLFCAHEEIMTPTSNLQLVNKAALGLDPMISIQGSC